MPTKQRQEQQQPQQPTSTSMPFQFGDVVEVTAVPRGAYGSAQGTQYKMIEDAIRKTCFSEGRPNNKALPVKVPANEKKDKFSSKVIGSIRRHIPEVRSRLGKPEGSKDYYLYLWIGEVGKRRTATNNSTS